MCNVKTYPDRCWRIILYHDTSTMSPRFLLQQLLAWSRCLARDAWLVPWWWPFSSWLRCLMPCISTWRVPRKSVSLRNYHKRPWLQVRCSCSCSCSFFLLLTHSFPGIYKAEQFSAVQNQWIVNPEVKIQITVEVNVGYRACCKNKN